MWPYLLVCMCLVAVVQPIHVWFVSFEEDFPEIVIDNTQRKQKRYVIEVSVIPA